MLKVFKYELHADANQFGGTWEDHQELDMPRGAKFLSVGMQAGRPMLWALVNTAGGPEKRRVYITPTGKELGDEFAGRTFIGTLIFGAGQIILHVWE